MYSDDENKIQYAFMMIKNMNCLTILRDIMDTPSFKALYTMLSAIAADDVLAIEKSYHRVTQQLFVANPRRISGNLLMDFIIAWIVENENRFSLDASQGISDPLTYAAMNNDVKSLLHIGSIATEDIQRWCDIPGANAGIVMKSAYDSIDAKSSKHIDVSSDIAACNLVRWNYEDIDVSDTYVCDGALNDIYNLFLSANPNGATDELWSFFNEYGTGDFLKYRVFFSDSKTILKPASESLFYSGIDTFMCDDVRMALCDNVKCFARDECGVNTVLCGQSGSGKTSILLSLVHEATQPHFVYLSGRDIGRLNDLFEKLSYSPLKFVVLIDDAHMCRNEIIRCVGTVYQPANVLVIAAADDNLCNEYFDSVMSISLPTLDDAAAYISKLTGKSDTEEIKNLCMDCQIETKKPLTRRTINYVLQKIQSK